MEEETEFEGVDEVRYRVPVTCSSALRISRLIRLKIRDGTAEPVSRGQIPRREREQGIIRFSSSADHEQNWQPYLVDPCSCNMMCGNTYDGGGRRYELHTTGSRVKVLLLHIAVGNNIILKYLGISNPAL